MRSVCRRVSVIVLMIAAMAFVPAAGNLAGQMEPMSGVLPQGQVWAETISDDCGETEGTVTFAIDDEGTMSISGMGKIKEQTKAANYPWYQHRTKVNKLIVGEGVTNVPNNAFNGMTNLKAVELPSTLGAWGTGVFSSSSNIETISVAEGGSFSAENNILFGENKTRLILSVKNVSGEIVLPESLKTIDANGLDGRSDITSLELPQGLQTIGNYAFRNLKQVSSITIPDSVTSIGSNAFQNWEELKKVSVPNSVTALNNYTFSGCKKMTEATLPEGLQSIGSYAFQNCESLGRIEIPENVTKIGASAFTKTAVTGIDLPAGLKTLEASAFAECKQLESIVIPTGVTVLGTSATNSSVFLNCTSLESATLPEGLTTIGASAFKGCSALKTITIPDTVNTIGAQAFQQCTSLESVSVPAGVTSLTGTFAGCTSLKRIDLPDGLTELKQGGSGSTMVSPFMECESLEEITIPGGVTSIPKDTFNGCTSLKTLGLQNGVTSIGQNAYKGCTSLEDITIPSTVNKVMGGAFENCENLNRVRLAEGMTDFNGSNNSATTAFKNCSRLTEIYLPDSLESFNPITFEQADSIQRIIVSEDAKFTVVDGVLYDKNVEKLIYVPASYSGKLTLPASVKETGSRVAGYTHALTEVVFPEGFTKVGDSAFYYADGLRKVTLPGTLKSIGASGFRATDLRSVTIPDNVTSIGANAFTLCEKLESAVIGKGVKQIPQAMFFNCYALSDLTIPEGVTSIGNQAFSGTQISEYVIPDGCKTIGATALANNTNLNTVLLPDSLTSIPATAFTGDTGLKYIYFKGTQEQWNALKCTPPYGTVIIDYKGVDETLPVAAINQQPRSAVYEKGQEPEPLQVTVTPEGVEGEQYFYTWYKNTTGKAEGGTTVEGTAVDNGLSCTPVTEKIGSAYYYCVITRMVNGYTAKRTVSDVAAVTVKMQMDGGGSEQDPFQIKDANDLKTVYNMVKEGNSLAGVYLKMTADIELPADWDSIGVLKEGATGSAQGKNVDPFSGVFDGGGHTITVPEEGLPLFGYVRNATIRNLNVYGSKINGTGLVNHYERDYETGSSQSEFGSNAKHIVTIENVTLKAGTKTRESGLIGENNQSQDASSMNPVMIVSCSAEEGVEIGYNHDEDQIGTFAGRVCGTIINCESSADVYGNSRVGGLAGCQDVAMGILHVNNSSFHGTVHATGSMAGGIVGTGYRGSAPNALCVDIKNCHADGTVNGSDMVGGILGAEDEVAQCWGNGIGYICNNLFTGKLHPEEGAKYVGGIVGYYRSLNKYTIFDNNHFAADCGARHWLGGAQFIDTSAEHETDSDTVYINTKNGVAGCPHVQFCDWQQGLNRTDDPLGKTAPALGAAASQESLKNGDILAMLNAGRYGMKNWTTDENGNPIISTEPVCYQLEVSGSYKTEYVIGDKLDTEHMILSATWTDGSTTHPSIDDVVIEGFDSTTRGVQRVSISYGSAKAELTVRVLKKSGPEDKIRVTFSLLGDDNHGADTADIHTLKMGTLDPWIEATEIEVDVNATVRDLLEQAVAGNYDLRGSISYIAGITSKNGSELAEKTNGVNSGWMYTLNGVHSQNTVNEQFLENGDEVIFHYTDDYMFEEDDLDVSGVRKLISEIDALPAVEEAQESDVESVWAAIDALAGLENDLDNLVPSEQRQKLDGLNEKLTQGAADQYQQQAAQDMEDADAAIAEAQESSRLAQEAYGSGSGNAADLANAALNYARAATEKARKAADSAEKAMGAMGRMKAIAEKSGDADRIEAARAALETAQQTADAAADMKTAAENLQSDAEGLIGRMKQDADEAQKAEEAAKAAASRIAAAKNMKVKKLKVKIRRGRGKTSRATVTWKKTKGAAGYQVQYKKKGTKWKDLKKSTATPRVTANKLRKGNRYSFRVRAYDMVQGQIYYGKWTKIKTVRVRR